jgi:hypothetical protein
VGQAEKQIPRGVYPGPLRYRCDNIADHALPGQSLIVRLIEQYRLCRLISKGAFRLSLE